MPASLQSQIGSVQQTTQALAESISSDIRVAMPGIIQSFDEDAVTCVVLPAVKGREADRAGNVTSHNLPLLMDVPVIFPRGGGVTLTFPIKAGDECLVVFADRCIDFWWQNGGVQESVSDRQHHLGDGFAIVGPQSQAQKISGISTRAAQLRTDDGAAFIELEPGSHEVTVTTPGKLTATAMGGTEITSPDINITGNVTISGNIALNGNFAQTGAAKITGLLTATNVIAGSTNMLTHTHGGVQPGNGNSGGPQ